MRPCLFFYSKECLFFTVRRVPEGLGADAVLGDPHALRALHRPGMFQIRTAVLSLLPETTRFPSGEKSTEKTELLWPVSSCSWVPDSAFQIRTVLSPLPETTRFPSGEKPTE